MHLIIQYKIQLIIHITVYMHVYHRTPNKCNTLHITTQFITMVTIPFIRQTKACSLQNLYICKRVLHVRRHKHTINRCHHMLVKLPVHRRRQGRSASVREGASCDIIRVIIIVIIDLLKSLCIHYKIQMHCSLLY